MTVFGNRYENLRVLVTGHTGFKGAWLSTWLLRLGAQVHGVSLGGAVSDPSVFEILGLDQRLHHHVADIRDETSLRRIVHEIRPDIIFHLAAQPIVALAYGDPLSTFLINAMGTANVLEALRRADHPCCAVLITSDKAYDNREWDWGYRESDRLGGRDPYSASKACAELIIRSYHASFFSGADSLVRVASARAGNVIGGGDWAEGRVVPDCVRAWASGRPVEIRNPHSTRPWQHVLEPLSGYLALGSALLGGEPVSGEPFNFGPKAEMNAPVVALIDALARYWSFRPGSDRIQCVGPADLPEAGLLKLSCDKALARLQWRPVLDIRAAARLTATWYATYYKRPNGLIYELTCTQIDEYLSLARDEGVAWATATT